MTLSLISGSTAFTRLIGVDVPFGERLLAGNVCGGTVRDTKRSVLRTLMPSSFKNTPTVKDSSIACPVTNGLRLPIPLPADGWTIISVIRNHKRPIGTVLPVVADFAPGTRGPSFIDGSGLAIMGAFAQLSVVSVYHGAAGITQGARVSIEAQDGGVPSFMAATVASIESRAHAGMSGELISATAPLSGRDSVGWVGKPLYVGTDARPIGGPAVDNAYAPEVYLSLVYAPLSTFEVSQVYNWAREFILQRTGLQLG